MAHYAFLDSNNIVTSVIVGKDETDNSENWEVYYGNFKGQTCKRTSYNTKGGVHLKGGTAFRKNYAGIGYTFDSVRDAFISAKPYPSWSLNESTCLWDSPVSYPEDSEDIVVYIWNEEDQEWVEPS